MASVVVVAKPADVLSLEECKKHCRVDFDDDDDLIAVYARAAQEHFDGPIGSLHRSIGLQTLELRAPCLDGLHGDALPCGPVVSIESVTYEDPDGVVRTMPGGDDADYQLIDAGAVAARIALKPGKSWPQTNGGENAVRVRYQAGYAVADVPVPLKQAMLLLAGHWYANREEVVTSGPVSRVPAAAEALSAPFRVWR